MAIFELPSTKYQRYLLDTNIIRELVEIHNEFVIKNLDRCYDDCVWIPVVAYAEQFLGLGTLVLKSRDERRAVLNSALYMEYAAYLNTFPMLPYTSDAAKHIKGMIANVSLSDKRIAAMALSHDFIVVTKNTKDFKQLLPESHYIDWTTDPKYL